MYLVKFLDTSTIILFMYTYILYTRSKNTRISSRINYNTSEGTKSYKFIAVADLINSKLLLLPKSYGYRNKAKKIPVGVLSTVRLNDSKLSSHTV